MVARLEREARVLASIDSPHVVRVVGFGRASLDDDPKPRAYVAMESLTGRDLGAVLSGGALPESRVLDLVEGALAGLAAAHAAGVLHRDLKPENVFLASEGTRNEVVKLLDFGMAKSERELAGALFATAHGVVVGTPSYLAPEQARGDAVDARADVYAMGAILYECLAGRPPHVGATSEATLLAIAEGRAADLGALGGRASSRVAKLIGRALAPRPEDRFASADAMAEALRRAREPATDESAPRSSDGERMRAVFVPALVAMALGAAITFAILALR